ncbi:hypothetical protein Vretimale_3904 [Volvox reticuliferus]|uniref:Uncharacterized protein n=1 Tax=Volvox reticuliferus TaxID=1737510 RepID=A0A8J4BYT6_9CHLO|nr:hypothetical protein Vretifemale_1507 [Volvox reticuliferus]GIL98534.1 hypothetical protein Vretimale_3904 [Volvox reticuliferus]
MGTIFRAQAGILLLLLRTLLCSFFLTINIASEHGAQIHGNSPDTAASAVFSCYNSQHVPEPITIGSYLHGIPSRSLRIHRIWWSKRKHRLALTMFTQSGLDRLKSLERQCHGYPGGLITVAVWVPIIVAPATLPTPGQNPQRGYNLTATQSAMLANATDTVDRFYRIFEPHSNDSLADSHLRTCVLRVVLVYELVADSIMATLMPLNILRNTALLMATTPLVAMVDADVLLNWGLAAKVLMNASRVVMMERQAMQEQTAWVMPIFDTNEALSIPERISLAQEAVADGPNPKAKLLDMWQKRGLVFPYGAHGFMLGHGPTDYDAWSHTSSDYNVTYQAGYEPFFIGARKTLIPYDSRFRGYFKDKIVNVAYVASMGSTFRILPDVWMVHQAHLPSMASYKWLKNHHTANITTPLDKHIRIVNGSWVTARKANSIHSYSTYEESLVHMSEGKYKLVTDKATEHCRSVLPWWQNHTASDRRR